MLPKFSYFLFLAVADLGEAYKFRDKLGVSLDNGFARIDTLNWDACHEAGNLIKQVEAYKESHGHSPELVQVDKINATRENRVWLKQRGGRITALPLSRKPVKKKQSYYQKRKKHRKQQK